jgi:phage gpG-like protein
MVIAELLGGPQVLNHLTSLPEEAQRVLKSEVRSLAVELAGYVKESKLTGEVLHVRTGRLRRSITFRVDEQGSQITGIVGTNVEYAAAHEFGVDMFKMVTVREYLRKCKSRNRYAITRGRAFTAEDGSKGHMLKRVVSAEGVAVVHSFNRNQHIVLPEKSFLRSALKDLGPEIREDLEAAVRRAVTR